MTVPLLLSILAIAALALWMGGLVTLGAIVAPTVFRLVPLPASADAMTTVFRRFDKLAVGCACVVLAVEVARALPRTDHKHANDLARRIGRLDLARGAVAVAASALQLFEAFSISPAIESLHREGAIRGLGEGGLRLESLHAQAEHLAGATLALGLALIVLHGLTLTRARTSKELTQ
jgi:hypothetical protein